MLLINSFFYLIIISQLNPNFVRCQRDFPNPAIIDPGPCACDIQASACDANCCCDPNCSDDDLKASPVCQSGRTIYSYSSNPEQKLETWNCSNGTSAALYDYFPFVCIQLKQNEIVGDFYPIDNITFINNDESTDDLRQSFVNDYPQLFQKIQPDEDTPSAYTVGSPVLAGTSTGDRVALPGILMGSYCQVDAPVLFGVDRDVTCTVNSTILCTMINGVTSIWSGDDTSSSVNITFFTGTYTTPPTPSTPSSSEESYFLSGYAQSIDDIAHEVGNIDDYCPGHHPIARIQRYKGICNLTTPCSTSPPYFVTWTECPLRDSFSYKDISDNFLPGLTPSTDDAINSNDFDAASNGTLTCPNTIRRVFYRFNYSSITNIISTVDVYVLTDSLTPSTPSNTRITIQWNDIDGEVAANTTVPRGYNNDEALRFYRNGVTSYVAFPIPNSDGYCASDNTPTTLRYKRDFSSSCFIQLLQSTLGECHKLKLNMYLYLNAFYAPATDVWTYPDGNSSTISIRDDTQDSNDLDRIDVTRKNNRLNSTYITDTELSQSSYKIYDTTDYLKVCFDVPSGIFVEFGYIRVPISSDVSFERIVSVRYTYTYSNWSFDCTGTSCGDSTSTQKYLVTFQSSFVDYTNKLLHRTDTTRSDLTSADNYIQHLLWLITPEYKGEPGYRNYTIAMILIFTAIGGVVLHILLFGFMCPF